MSGSLEVGFLELQLLLFHLASMTVVVSLLQCIVGYLWLHGMLVHVSLLHVLLLLQDTGPRGTGLFWKVLFIIVMWFACRRPMVLELTLLRLLDMCMAAIWSFSPLAQGDSPEVLHF